MSDNDGILEQLIDQLSDAIFVVDIPGGTIVDVNQQACEMHGYSYDEMIGLSPAEVSKTFPKETDWHNHVPQVKQEGGIQVHTDHIRKDGSTFPVQVHAQHVSLNGDEYIVASARDVTEDKRDNDSIYKSHSRYSSVFQFGPNALWEENRSDVSARLDRLRESGVEDMEAYLEEHPDELDDMIQSIEVIDVNQQAIELYGARDRQELIDHFRDAIIDRHRDMFRSQFVALARGETEWEDRTKIITLDGETLHVRLNMVVPPGHRDDLSQVFISVIDITERVNARRQLSRRETFLSTIVENVPGITYRCSLDSDWTMQFISEGARDLTGYPAEGFIDNRERSYASVIVPEDRDHVEEQVMEGVESGEPFEMEYRIERADGEIRWVFERGQAVYDDNGDVEFLSGVILDQTERKEADEKLRESEARFRSTFEQAAVGIAHVNLDGSFRRLNDKFCDLLGYERDELLEMSFQEITHPEDLDRDLENVDQLVSGEQDTYTIEKRYLRRDDSVLWVRLTVSLVESDDKSDYFVSVIEDITERKRGERALQQSKEGLHDFYRITTNPAHNFHEKIERVLDLGRNHFEMDTGLCTTLKDDTIILDRVRGKHAEELEGMELQLEDAYCRETVEEQGLNVIHDAINEGWEEEPAFENTPFDSYLGAKIYVNDEVYGTLCFEGEEPHSSQFLENQKNFIRIMAQWIGFEIQRRQTQRQLEESERRFRQMAENIDEVFWLTDPDKREILYASPAYETIWGRSVESLYDNPEQFIEAIHPDDRERVEQAVSRQGDGDYDLQYRIVQPDGEIRWIHDRAFPVGDEESPTRIAGVAEDITERKQIQHEHDRLFNLSEDMICVADMEGYFLDINPAFSEVLGYEKERLMEEPFFQFIHEEDREKTRDVMGRLLEGEDVSGFENRYITRDGEIRWFQWNATPSEDRIYAVARDITQQRQYRDQLEQALDEKQVLLEEVHHRVKNNLQVISSLLDMQSRELESGPSLDAFRDSVSRIRSMALIHEKLYESDNLDQVSMDTYLEELVHYLMQSYRTGDHEIRFDVEPVSLPTGQSISLGMVVNELVSNAIQHGFEEDEQGVVEVHFHRIGSNRGCLVVRDNGRGVPDDFDPESMTSMGMKVIRSLAKYDLDGDIEFDDDNGLKVSIEFPLEVAGGSE